MNRRKFSKMVAIAGAGTAIAPVISSSQNSRTAALRLGGPVFKKFTDPGEWIAELKRLSYSATFCPVPLLTTPEVIRSYEKAAFDAHIVIAEVGAWSNPIDPDDVKRKAAIEKCIRSLELAESIGARCCVNISGSKNPNQWAGPHRDNLTPATFDLIVETSRIIIDAVKPGRTFYSLETMPWAYPDSVESYLRLIKAIDRRGFAVHFDPVNLVVSPQVYYKTGDLIKDFVNKLGPWIKSCHAKDILLAENTAQAQFSEVRPGLGNLDYPVLLSMLSKLDNVPLMIEHLKTEEEYKLAADYIRSKA